MISKYKYIKYGAVLAVLSLLILISSCAGIKSPVKPAGQPGASGETAPVYYGSGNGESSIEAIQQAKKQGVKNAAIDLLGSASAKGQKLELDAFFDTINDIEPYTVPGSQQTIESRSSDGFYYNLGIRVNLEVLAMKLKAADILGGQIDGKEGNVYRLPNQAAPKVVASNQKAKEKQPEISVEPVEKPESPPVVSPQATAEELKIIAAYLDSLTYMVYYNEEAAADPYLTRAAVISANRYLDSRGAEYVDLSQIERIKADQQIVYEEETGEVVSLVQWIAHKLNADIYIEISLTTSTKTEGSNFYGSASVVLNSFNASTAEGLGSAVYQTIPPAFSRISKEDALTNAVSAAVFNCMDAIVAETENETAKAASRGFKYNLIMLNTPDSRMLRDFEKRMGRYVREIKRASYSPEESAFEIYLIGGIADLEDIVYDAAEAVPGLDGLLLIMQRGNSITFDTGM